MPKRDGFEPVDDRPVAVPVRFRAPPGEVDRMREMMARLSKEMGKVGVETLDESLDFNIDEDDDGPISPSETRLMVEERLLTEREEADRIIAQRREAALLRRRFGYVQQRRTGDAREGSGVDGKVGAAAGVEGGAAGERRGGVSEGRGGSERLGKEGDA